MESSTKKYIPILTFIMGAVWFYLGIAKYSWMVDEVPGSGFFPAIIAMLLMVTSIIAFFSDFKAEKVKYQLSYAYPVIAVLMMLLLSQVIGLTISIFLYLVYWIGFYEKYSLKMTLIFSITTTVCVYGIFVMWLKVPFPTGLIGI